MEIIEPQAKGPESASQFSWEEVHQLQINLIEESKLEPMDWIDKYSRRFRQIIEEHPELYKLYKNNVEGLKDFIHRELGDEKRNYN